MPSSNPTSARRAGAGGPSTGRPSTQPGFFSRGGRHGGGGGIIRVESTSTTAAAAAAHRSVQPAAELVDQYALPSSIATLSPPPRKPPVPYLSKLSSVAKQQQQEVHYPVVVEEEDDKNEAAEGKQGRRKQKECDSTTTTPRNNQKDGGDHQHNNNNNNNNTSGYTTTPRRRKKEEIAKDDEDGCSSTRTTPRLGAMSAEAAPPAPTHLAGGAEVGEDGLDVEMSNKSAPQQHQEGAPASAAQRSTTSLPSPSERVVPHKIHPDASTGKPLQYFNSKSRQSSKNGTSSDAVQEQEEQQRTAASDVELKCAAFIQAAAKRQQLVEALKLNFSSSRTNLQYYLEKQQNTIQHLQERCDKNSEELHTERSNARRQQQGHYYHSPKSSATVMASIMKMPTAAELRARFALDSPVGKPSPVSQQQQQDHALQNGRGVRGEEEESAAPLTHNESIFELPPKDSGEDSVVVPTTVVTLSPPPQEDEEDHHQYHHHQRSVVGNESLFSIGGRSITPSKEEGEGPSSNRLHMQQQQNDYDDNNSLSDTVGNLMAQYARQQQQQQQQGHQQQQQPLSPTPPLHNDHHQDREVSNDSIMDVPSPTGIASAETKATDEGGSPRSPKWSTQYTGGGSFARSSSGHHLIPKLGEREGSYALTENDSLVFAPESGSGSPTAAAGLDETIGSSVSIPHDFAGNNYQHDDDDGSMSTISSRAPSCSPPGSARRGGPGRGASPINKDLL